MQESWEGVRGKGRESRSNIEMVSCLILFDLIVYCLFLSFQPFNFCEFGNSICPVPSMCLLAGGPNGCKKWLLKNRIFSFYKPKQQEI